VSEAKNVQLVRTLLRAIGERDLPRLLELTAADVEWRSFFAALREGGLYRGHDGMRQYVADVSEAFDTMRPEIRDVLDIGETIVGVGQIHYRGRGSGLESDELAGWVFRFRGGRVAYFHAFREPDRVFARVGLAE
jgi:ketosteroid isomerase-like protein